MRKTVKAAARCARVPVLVAYNFPFRDCAQYSAGGAIDAAAYKAWIDGFAAGIGNGRRSSSSSPTASASSPYNDDVDVPADGHRRRRGPRPRPGRGPSDALRAAQLRGRQARSSAPNALVYLDGTHSAWLGVGDIAEPAGRTAGVAARRRASSSTSRTTSSRRTSCSTAPGSRRASPTPPQVAARRLRVLPEPVLERRAAAVQDRQINGEWTAPRWTRRRWSDASDTVALNTSGINLRYANMLGAIRPTFTSSSTRAATAGGRST